MRVSGTLALLAALAFLPAHAEDPPTDPASAARPTIDRANTDWERCIVTLELDCIVASYADNALFVLPDGTTVVGKAAIRELYAARAPEHDHHPLCGHPQRRRRRHRARPCL
jgi:hypothetical protein